MRLRQLLVLSRDLAKSKEFYAQGLGLPLLRSSETFAEFDTRSGVSLCVKLAQRLVAEGQARTDHWDSRSIDCCTT